TGEQTRMVLVCFGRIVANCRHAGISLVARCVDRECEAWASTASHVCIDHLIGARRLVGRVRLVGLCIRAPRARLWSLAHGLDHRCCLVDLALRAASASQPAGRLDSVVDARDGCYAPHTSRHLFTWWANRLGAELVSRLG